MSKSHTDHDVQQTVIAGGSAGAHVVTGITEDDVLLWVLNLTDDADLTDEFSISDDDEIDNTDGTDTTGDTLLVGWNAADPRGGDLNRN